MQDESTPTSGHPDDRAEATVLLLLLADDASFPWSVREIQLELGELALADDAVANLRGSGLVHRCGDFVFPTRAAVRYAELHDIRP
jgi:hypothetical protein